MSEEICLEDAFSTEELKQLEKIAGELGMTLQELAMTAIESLAKQYNVEIPQKKP